MLFAYPFYKDMAVITQGKKNPYFSSLNGSSGILQAYPLPLLFRMAG